MLTLRLILAVISTTLLFVSTSDAIWTSDNIELLDHNVRDRHGKTYVTGLIQNTHETDNSFKTTVIVSFKKDYTVVLVVNHLIHNDNFLYLGAGDTHDLTFQVDILSDDYDTYDIRVVGSFVVQFPESVDEYLVEGEVSIYKENLTIVRWKNDRGALFVTAYGEFTNHSNAVITDVVVSVSFYETGGILISIASANKDNNPLLGSLINPGETIPFVATQFTFGTIDSWRVRTSFDPINIVGFFQDEGEIPSTVERISWGMIKSTF